MVFLFSYVHLATVMKKLPSAPIMAVVHIITCSVDWGEGSIERSFEFVIGVIECDSNTDLFTWSSKTAYSKSLSVKVSQERL